MSNLPVSDEILEIGKADPECNTSTVTIPRPRHEALMAAAKVFAGYFRFGSWGDDAHCAIAALRAAGIETEE